MTLKCGQLGSFLYWAEKRARCEPSAQRASRAGQGHSGCVLCPGRALGTRNPVTQTCFFQRDVSTHTGVCLLKNQKKRQKHNSVKERCPLGVWVYIPAVHDPRGHKNCSAFTFWQRRLSSWSLAVWEAAALI